ncbi:MAG: hypothetical protein WBQ43_02755 [Terriglobales bacterium]
MACENNHITNDFLKAPGLWNGTRGATPVTDSERKQLAAAQRNAGRDLTFAEKKQLLLRLRKDMPTLKPPQNIAKQS